jgi:hypothetical protein
MSTVVDQKIAWGPRINRERLPKLYPPQSVIEFEPPPAGIDNLGISATDKFFLPRRGEFVVDFKGFVRVARSEPTTNRWTTTEVYTNMYDMFMRGKNPTLGTIIVSLNPECLSTGQITTPFCDLDQEKPEKACRMAVSAMFQLLDIGLTVFNKEPIELTIDNVRTIPPAGNPGVGRIYRHLPLYNVVDPGGLPVAYLTSLDFCMGTYISESDIDALRAD